MQVIMDEPPPKGNSRKMTDQSGRNAVEFEAFGSRILETNEIMSISAKLHAFVYYSTTRILWTMEKRKNRTIKRAFRTRVGQVLPSLIESRGSDYLAGIFEKLQDIEDLIEILARESARQSKRRK